MKQAYKIFALAVVGFFASAGLAFAQFGATEVNVLVGTTTDDIEAVLSGSLPVVLAVVGALIGLGILMRYIKRWIGRR